ncbi:putative aldouronate transport system permease protein [Anaerobacterium chartisolvens]|uniref:Putative aldouronate transport system permease protein n=1 Tax=Anaerobacterium chartisolvens TaxID=1297424 RepID=A0A369BD56_9FIRM|nr:carbohydrate ABC transporter permease [Anaerobacterium chartisolvens]RCX19473.1 putative aldouronate transport system permease protein [Anaerobacterium chartisolvens]
MKENKTYKIISNAILILMTLMMILPLVLVFISSITDDNVLIANGYSFFPEKLSLGAYQYIQTFIDMILRAYGITIAATVVGTVIGTVITAMMSYGLSIKDLPGKKAISFFVFFTMLFNGGLVPSYIMWTSMKITNTIWAYIFPFLLTNAFNIILMRSYFSANIPNEIYESAKIDGAGYLRIFWKIAMPLGKPILVTIGLFTVLIYWNDWTNGLYFISEPSMLSIQALLNKMMANIQATVSYANYNKGSGSTPNIHPVSIRMAIAFIAILPILILYPFLQKYFADGIMLGAVKG